LALGDYSHASGIGTIVNADYATVIGAYNDPSTSGLFTIGNGNGDNNRSNALTVD